MAEKRLIDADKIYDAIERRYQVSSGIEHRCERDFLDLICASDTVDAVEVVRCRECVNCLIDHTERKYHLCMRHNSVFPRKVDLMDFCSYGERKDGDGNG